MRTLVVLLGLTTLAAAADTIVPTEPRTPAEELKGFKLPAGFEAQLVASEPEIQKPMQLAFDAKGRLWVTTSHHYPFAAETDKSTDKLFILSDFDANGKAKSVVAFDDKLNIPIGICPLSDGKSVIVGEAGRILKLTDTDGDGKADKREVLFTGFGIRDTHGMTNSYTLLPDGWIYACHGYLNDSTVKGKDGHEVHMQSGNTFRFRPDGSRIEIYTRGQVNPFGMCTDPWLNLYTADCHSRPMTQLIRGAVYDSFGKPHDGLGYAPHVMNHLHGSTGLCGITYYAADYYPKEWTGVMFVGNCVTSRINCDRISWHGSTPVGKELPDFLVSDDAWFRPVDIKLGPDGALYVSDFYNRIIGHYEVDLKHPGRDKDRGRIWRIVKKGSPPMHAARFDVPDAAMTALRALVAKADWTDADRQNNLATFRDSKSIQMQRAAVEGITAHSHALFIEPLLDYIPKIPADDTHMRMAARIALRNCIVAAGGMEKVKHLVTPERVVTLFDVALAIRSRDSHTFLAKTFTNDRLPPGQEQAAAEILGRYESEMAIEILNTHKVISVATISALLSGLQTAGVKGLSPETMKRITTYVLLAMPIEGKGIDQPAAVLRMLMSFPEFATLNARNKHLIITATLPLLDIGTSLTARMDLAEALIRIPDDQAQSILTGILNDAGEDVRLRARIISAKLVKPTTADRTIAKGLLKTAPYALASTIANSLAGDAVGAEILLALVKSGEAPARLLQEKSVVTRLKASKLPEVDARITELTKNLPSVEKRIDDLIKARAAGFKKATVDIAKGKEVFAKNCANCHQLNNEGAKVGPQLDGVGIRGLERLLEDTMDPNRNIDQAFRATKVDLKDGRSITGLLKGEEGDVYIIYDALGKEQRIPKADVDDKTTLGQSAMPGNLDTIIPEADYYHLLGYLLDQKPKK
ncbi:hypothetical protein BH11PLA2_BH11PLA2_20020 [soil metagenome]